MSTFYTNDLQRSVARNEVCKAFGIKITSNAQVVQVAKNASFDALWIDLEHGWLSLEATSNLCNVGHLTGISPFVRVPYQCGSGFVQRVLDGGAMGIVFPHIHSAEDARAAVAMCKYPPVGTRSMTGLMPLFGMRPTGLDDVVSFANRSGSTVFAMIESRSGVEQADAIAAVTGVEVLLIGSMDLTIDMGVGGQFDSEQYRQAVERVGAACKKYGKILGVAGVYNSPERHSWLINTVGVRFMLVQQDVSLMAEGGRQATAAVPVVE